MSRRPKTTKSNISKDHVTDEDKMRQPERDELYADQAYWDRRYQVCCISSSCCPTLSRPLLNPNLLSLNGSLTLALFPLSWSKLSQGRRLSLILGLPRYCSPSVTSLKMWNIDVPSRNASCWVLRHDGRDRLLTNLHSQGSSIYISSCS